MWVKSYRGAIIRHRHAPLLQYMLLLQCYTQSLSRTILNVSRFHEVDALKRKTILREASDKTGEQQRGASVFQQEVVQVLSVPHLCLHILLQLLPPPLNRENSASRDPYYTITRTIVVRLVVKPLERKKAPFFSFSLSFTLLRDCAGCKAIRRFFITRPE